MEKEWTEQSQWFTLQKSLQIFVSIFPPLFSWKYIGLPCTPPLLYICLYPLPCISLSKPDPPCPPPYPNTLGALAPTDLEEHMFYF